MQDHNEAEERTVEEIRNNELRSDVASSNEPKGHLTEEPPTFDEVFGDVDFGDDEEDDEEALWEVPDEEDLPELPTAEEAELGELCRVPDDEDDDFLSEEIAELEEEVEDMDPLPTAEEAELGELSKTPRRTQFDDLELVDDEASDLIEALTGGEGQ